MVTEFPSYLDVLESRFQQRRLANPSYSLRAFARDLSISVSQPSELRSGKYGVSPNRAESIVSKLGLNPDEAFRFLLDVKAKHSRSPKTKAKAKLLIRDYLTTQTHAVTESALNEIADWQHFSVLEYLRNNSVTTDLKAIAFELELTENIVSQCIERLIKVSLVKRTNTGLIKPAQRINKAGGTLPSKAVRNLHTSFMNKAIQEIQRQPIDKRTFGTVVLPINVKQVPKAIEMIEAFKKDFFNHSYFFIISKYCCIIFG